MAGLVSSLTLAAAMPAHARSDEQEETIQELSRRVVDLQKVVTVHEIEIERLQKQLVELRRELAAIIAAPPPAPEPSTRPVPPPPQVNEEDLDLEAFGQPVQRPGEALPSIQPLPATAPDEASEEPEPSPDLAQDLPSNDAQALYDQGYTLYHQQRYLDAEAAFQRFLVAHPESSLADNAQYWVGESRYARRDFEGALQAFGETVRRFPTGNKVPDALLKAGQSLEELGDQEGARETYGELLSRYPATAASAVAEERLKELP
ncbi:MAG: tol-pal system protein YbgF [Acidobacteriota bacterium]